MSIGWLSIPVSSPAPANSQAQYLARDSEGDLLNQEERRMLVNFPTMMSLIKDQTRGRLSPFVTSPSTPFAGRRFFASHS
jgi:hypothetical protein